MLAYHYHRLLFLLFLLLLLLLFPLLFNLVFIYFQSCFFRMFNSFVKFTFILSYTSLFIYLSRYHFPPPLLRPLFPLPPLFPPPPPPPPPPLFLPLKIFITKAKRTERQMHAHYGVEEKKVKRRRRKE